MKIVSSEYSMYKKRNPSDNSIFSFIIMNQQLVRVLFIFFNLQVRKETLSFNIMISITFRLLKMQLAANKKSIFTIYVQRAYHLIIYK